jgi:hypothetical protein
MIQPWWDFHGNAGEPLGSQGATSRAASFTLEDFKDFLGGMPSWGCHHGAVNKRQMTIEKEYLYLQTIITIILYTYSIYSCM